MDKTEQISLREDSAHFVAGLKTVGLAARLEPDYLLNFYRAGFFVFEKNGMVVRRESSVREIVPLSHGSQLQELYRRAKKLTLRSDISVSSDAAMPDVLHHCSRPELPDDQRWLGAKMQKALLGLHKLGFAHSVEVWAGDILAAGALTVIAGNTPTCLASFSRRDLPGYSGIGYLAMLELNLRLRLSGYRWFDSVQPSVLSRLQAGVSRPRRGLMRCGTKPLPAKIWLFATNRLCCRCEKCPTSNQDKTDGRPFPRQECDAPEEQDRSQAVENLRKTGARNRRRCQTRDAGPGA